MPNFCKDCVNVDNHTSNDCKWDCIGNPKHPNFKRGGGKMLDLDLQELKETYDEFFASKKRQSPAMNFIIACSLARPVPELIAEIERLREGIKLLNISDTCPPGMARQQCPDNTCRECWNKWIGDTK